MYESIVALVGVPPSGCEPLVYIFGLLFALFLLDSVSSLFVAVFNRR